ncbi:MAG: YkgJ family cysteine cluster protein [Acidobacteria bacterium]|nr:YkgJ family cysteine cluster protein [Acidobacteriota bacterium]
MEDSDFLQYKKLLEDVDLLTGNLHKQFVKQITCHLGCTGCCYQQLSLSQVEANFISKAIKTLPPPTQEKILFAAKAIKNNTSTTEACPMLDNLACVIYEFRPVICRTHGFPISFKDDETEETFLDVCPLNFSEEGESVELNLTDTVDIDRLNLRLAAINYAYSRDILEDNKKFAERVQMSEIIISTLTNLGL